MRFDIEGFITFDTEEASLVNLLTGDCIELSQTSMRLLTELLNHRSDILSRNEIFQSVFDKYGARASNSNLNQYISTLRRHLNDLGVEKEIIVTVPRIGFKISENAIINNDRDYHPPFFEEKITLIETKRRYPRLHYLIAKITVLLLVLTLIIIKPEFSITDNNDQKAIYDKCVIFFPSSLSLQDVMKDFDVMSQPLNCTQEKEVHVYKEQLQNTLGNIIQLLLIVCDTTNNSCVSFYFREKKNA